MPVNHGTNRGYTVYKCRCDGCREAHRVAAALDRERNKERINAGKREAYARNPAPVLASNQRWRDSLPDYKAYKAEYDKARRIREHDRIVELNRAYYLLNRQAYIEKAAKWKQENPERARELAREAYWRDPELARERNRRVMSELYAKDPDKYRGRAREWYKTPQGKIYAAAARARRRGVPYTDEALEWIASLVDPMCTYCGGVATSIDHIIAVSKGGTGELENLTPACRPCNSRKSSLSLDTFLARLAKEKEV